MFERRTLFILGAGASEEVGFPIGSGLADDIQTRLYFTISGMGDEDLSRNLMKLTWGDPNSKRDAAIQIRDGIAFSSSIDDFLDLHRANYFVQTVGKAAIVRAILSAERNSSLFVDRNVGPSSLNDEKLKATWFVKLMQMMSVGCLEPTRISEAISFIVFNYDRCLEQFLFESLQRQYGVSPHLAEQIVRSITIIHPYGSVADLMMHSRDRQRIPFGGYAPNGSDYFLLSRNIKTYTEQIEDEELKSSLKQEFAAADCIVFLGFAFHDQNMKLIAPPAILPGKVIFGTAYGVSEHNAEKITSNLMRMVNAWPNLDRQAKCSALLQDYRLGILTATP